VLAKAKRGPRLDRTAPTSHRLIATGLGRPESSPPPRHEARSYRRGYARVKGVGVAANEVEVGPVAELVPGVVRGAGKYAVGNANGELFAVTRRCRHLGADLANGSIDRRGCLVCPWHGARYDVATGRMIRGPQGLFAKIPGADAGYRLLTTVLPLGRGDVVEREGAVFVRKRDR
jgi:nitrite reductase/ring-hydroxylating ferredoxin subunit